jgi:hypothetical protein
VGQPVGFRRPFLDDDVDDDLEPDDDGDDDEDGARRVRAIRALSHTRTSRTSGGQKDLTPANLGVDDSARFVWPVGGRKQPTQRHVMQRVALRWKTHAFVEV